MLGENIALSPGKVVFQNELMQLIQYAPTTEEVFKRPLLIIPPWINKFYILDLRPKNSFIRWAVEQGHTVFVISWVNPNEELKAKSFEDYMTDGPLAALDAVEAATGEKDANVIGYWRDVLAQLEGLGVGHPDLEAALASLQVLQQVVETLHQVLAAALQGLAQHLRIGHQEVGGRHGVDELPGIEVDLLGGLVVQALNVLHRRLHPARGQQGTR